MQESCNEFNLLLEQVQAFW